MAGTTHDSRGRAKSEADWPLASLDHNRLARFIGSYRTRSVGCGCFGCCCRLRSCRCLLCGRRTRLRKRQWRDERASESDNCFLHYYASLFLVDVLPQTSWLEDIADAPKVLRVHLMFDRPRDAAIQD